MLDTHSVGMHIWVNLEIKANSEFILAAAGLSFGDVCDLTLRQIFLKRKIPFELSSLHLTKNGYISGFGAELPAVPEEIRATAADGTAGMYGSAAEGGKSD